jgi:hypothetical protein
MHVFPPILETVYAGLAKFNAETSELLTKLCEQVVVRKTAPSEGILQGVKNFEFGGGWGAGSGV